jgi:hypothetical protein
MKPSSNTPRYPLDVVGAVSDALKVITRRIDTPQVRRKAHAFLKHFAHRQLARLDLPLEMAEVPISYGGLGVLPFAVLSRVSPHLPTFAFSGSVSTSKWGLARYTTLLNKYGIKNDPGPLLQKAVNGLVVTDDIPKVTAGDRSKWRSSVRNKTFQIIPVQHEIMWFSPMVVTILSSIEPSQASLMNAEALLGTYRGTFAKWKTLEEEISIVKTLLPGSGISLMSYIKENHPIFRRDLRSYIRRGWSLTDAISWFFGSINLDVGDCHPEMIVTVTKAVVASVSILRITTPVHAVALISSRAYADALKRSLYYRTFWRW